MEEKNYLFCWILAGFSYDESDIFLLTFGTPYIIREYLGEGETAGVYDREQATTLNGYLIDTFGLDPDDVRHLNFSIWMQHTIVNDFTARRRDEKGLIYYDDSLLADIVGRYNDAYGTNFDSIKDKDSFLANVYENYLVAFQYPIDAEPLMAKPDFAHLMITIASYYSVDITDRTLIHGRDLAYYALVAGGANGIITATKEGLPSVEKRQVIFEASGWWGDIMGVAFMDANIQNDDYTADIDAVNIMGLLHDPDYSFSSVIEASSHYYTNTNPSENRAIMYMDYTNFDSDVFRVIVSSRGLYPQDLKTNNPAAYYYLASVYSGSPVLLDENSLDPAVEQRFFEQYRDTKTEIVYPGAEDQIYEYYFGNR